MVSPLWLTKTVETIFGNGYNRLKSVRLSQASKSFDKTAEDDEVLVEPEAKITVRPKSISRNTDFVVKRQKSWSGIGSLKRNKNKCDNRPVIPAVMLTFDKANLFEMEDNDEPSSYNYSETEILEFERNLREIVYELHRNRALLEGSRNAQNEIAMAHNDLKLQLENEKRNNKHSEIMLQQATQAAKNIENTLQETIEKLYKTEIKYDVVTRERDFLKSTLRDLHTENMNKTTEIEQLQGKLKCHQAFQQQLAETHNALKSRVLNFKDSMQQLKKLQENVDKVAELKETCINLQSMSEIILNEKKKILDEKERIEKELIMKTAELEQLKQLMTKYPMKENKTLIDYWKQTAEELRQQLKKTDDSNWQLTQALQASNESRSMAEARERELTSKIHQLENPLRRN